MVSGLVLAAPAVAEGPAIRGIVLDSNGKPIAKASVELVPAEGEFARGKRVLAGSLFAPSLAQTRSLADGSFVLHAPVTGFYTLIVRGEGFVSMGLPLGPLVEDASVAELRLHPDVGLSVPGKDGAGAPVAGALVRESASRWLWENSLPDLMSPGMALTGKMASPTCHASPASVSTCRCSTSASGRDLVGNSSARAPLVEVIRPGFVSPLLGAGSPGEIRRGARARRDLSAAR